MGTTNCNLKIVIKQHLEGLLTFLEPLLPLANFHMVDYFTSSSTKSVLPQEIQQEINDFGHDLTIERLLKNELTNLPRLEEFVTQTNKYTLKNNPHICKSLKAFNEETFKARKAGLKLNVFMTPKKSHEVEVLSALVASIKDLSGTTHLIDVGDGKGYLSSMLALNFNIPVLGIDASQINTNGAIKRVNKLAKSKTISQATSTDLYKQVTQYIQINSDINELVTNVFCTKKKGDAHKLGLIGLHTCGDLSSTSLKLFQNNCSIRTVCNVGCCYHLLSERYETFTSPSPIEAGFPLSAYLDSKRFTLGRKARMIAAQSVDRILDKQALPSTSLFYRALLEVVLCANKNNVNTNNKRVGKFRRPCANFFEYFHTSVSRLGLEDNFKISESELNAYLIEFKEREAELNLFYLIRSLLAPVVESVILIDRLLYLLENGCERSFLVQVFDPVISPRCYAVVSLKDDDT